MFTPRKRPYSRFVLRELDHPPYQFCVGDQAGSNLAAEHYAAIVRYVEEHPGTNLTAIATGALGAQDLANEELRRIIAELLDSGTLVVCGTVRFEQADLRYERVPACDVCGEKSAGNKVVLVKYNTPVVRCSGCGLLYANPRWKAEHLFGRYTPEYWEHYAETVQETATDPTANFARWRNYLSSLEHARQTGRILDVGCASGEFLVAAKTAGWEPYGVESSPIAAQQAATTTGGQVHTGTLDTAPYEDGYFDAITLWDVIEHPQSPRAYIERIFRLLRPGGMLSLTTPNIRSIAFRLLGKEWSAIGPNDHLYYFAPRTMERLLIECGFGVYYMGTTAAELATWQQWLRFPALQLFAPVLRNASLPVALRMLVGDELYAVATRPA